MNVFRRHISQIDTVNPPAVFHIQGHPGGRRNIGNGIFRMLLQLHGITGRTGKGMSGHLPQTFGIHFPDPLNHLEQSRPSRNPIGFERWRDRKADGLLGTALISHHQIHGKRVESPLHRLHGGIKGLQINRNKFTFLISHFPTPP